MGAYCLGLHCDIHPRSIPRPEHGGGTLHRSHGSLGGEDTVGGLHCGYYCEILLPGLNTASVAPSPFAQGCRLSVEEDQPKEARVTVCRDVNETSTTI